MDRDHLSDPNWDWWFQPTFLAILDQIWPITPLRQTMKPLKLVCYHDLTSVLGIYVSTQTNNGFEWPKVGFWRFQPIFLAILGLIWPIVPLRWSWKSYKSPIIILSCLFNVSVSIQTSMGMIRGQLSDQRWIFDHFSLFFGNFGPNLANFTPQITIIYPKTCLLSCSHVCFRYM